MTIPTGAPVAVQKMDPGDLVEFVGRFAPESEPLLEEGETITNLEVTPLADAAAVGVTVLEGEVNGVDRGPWIADDTMGEASLEIAEEHRSNAVFTPGFQAGLTFTVTTSANRRFQRTMVVEVIQQ